MCYQGCSGCGQCVVGKYKAVGKEGGMCFECGNKNDASATVCAKCGAPLIPAPGQGFKKTQ